MNIFKSSKLFALLATLFMVSFPLQKEAQVVHATEEVEISLISCEDAYVASGENADLNFGAANPIVIRKHTTSPKNDSQGYMKFAIPANIGSISSAIFEIGLQSPNPTTKENNFTLFTASSDWEEGDGKIAGATVDYETNPKYITYNNAPELFPTTQSPVDFASAIGTARDYRYSADVTDLVNNYIATFTDTTVVNYLTIGIASTVDRGESTNFQSRGYTSKEPKLTLTLGEFDDNKQTKELYNGLTYTTERVLNSSKTPVNMFALEVDMNTSLSFYTGLPDDQVPLEVGKRATVAEMAESAEANGKRVLAGINGDFFNASDDTLIQPRGLVIRDGVAYQTEYNGCTFFGILKNGNPIIGGSTEYWANKDNLQMAVGGDIDFLVENGVPCATNEEAGEHAPSTVNPRTAIGITDSNNVVMVVCDGRTAESNGMVLTDLAQYMVSKGCLTAINLDGGWSSTMVAKNFATASFEACNYPSNAGTLRPIGDSILVIDTNENATATKEMVTGFVYRYMHMSDIALDDMGTGQCLGENGYYQLAKQALTQLENNYQGAIDIFASDNDFANAYTRLQAWAHANNEVFDNSGFSSGANFLLIRQNNFNYLNVIVICGSTFMLITFIYILIKKKKKTNSK